MRCEALGSLRSEGHPATAWGTGVGAEQSPPAGGRRQGLSQDGPWAKVAPTLLLGTAHQTCKTLSPTQGRRGCCGQEAPYLVDGIPALGAVAEEVPSEDDAGHVGGTALLPLVPQLPRHHVHQQLGAQQALAPASTQAQTGHQQHKPAAEVGVLWVPWKQVPPPPSPSRVSRKMESRDRDSPGPLPGTPSTCSPVQVKGWCRRLRSQPCEAVVLHQELAIVSCRAQHDQHCPWEQQRQVQGARGPTSSSTHTAQPAPSPPRWQVPLRTCVLGPLPLGSGGN